MSATWRIVCFRHFVSDFALRIHNMNAALLFFLLLAFVAAADECICKCEYPEHHRRHLDATTDIIDGVRTELTSLGDAVDKIGDFLVDMKNDIVDSAKNTSEAIGDALEDTKDDLAQGFESFSNGISSAIENAKTTVFTLTIVAGTLAGAIILFDVYKLAKNCCKRKNS